MRYISIFTLALFIAFAASNLSAASVEEYISKAMELQKTGQYDQAIALLEKGHTEFPGNTNLYAYSGLYTGMKAGTAANFQEAGVLSAKSFELLDKAVSLDPANPVALLFRGLMSVKVPEFLGKLDGGITDLETASDISGKFPESLSIENKVLLYDLLGEAYAKKNAGKKAVAAWKTVIILAPGSDMAKAAEANIEKLYLSEAATTKPAETKPGAESDKPAEDSGKLEKKGKEAFDRGEFQLARDLFEEAAEVNPQSAFAYKWLGLSIARLGEVGYDERIAKDTDLRTNLVFASMNSFDKAVELDPDDMELRFLRGSMGVYFPFFANKLEQSIIDLNMVMNSEVSDSLKAESKYILGVAHQKKGMSYWIDVAVRHSGSEAAQMVYSSVRPRIKRLDQTEHKKPCLAVDFVLGFKDELAPQTAIWIEDKEGNYINTVYVSGFSGYVKEKQVVLPIWAASSEFNNIDAVTSASIDIGHYIYIWGLKDFEGKKIKKGDYVVNVEVSYWPSMKYQLAKTEITIGGKSKKKRVEEGNFIPYLEVQYLKD